jgi:membrane protease YdiL (CAAX protease family)
MFLILFEIFVVLVLPVILWGLKVIPFKFRWEAFTIGCLIAIGILFKDHAGLHELGIRTDNISHALWPYVIFTFFCSLGLMAVAKFQHKNFSFQYKGLIKILFLILLASFGQEFIYRSFIFFKLENLTESFGLIIFVNALLFSLPHLIHEDYKSAVILSFLGGLLLATMYYNFPNLILISLSHAVLLFTVFALNLFYKKPTKNGTIG